MVTYIAFLRGINVGGHKVIKMDVLSHLFTSFKLKNVKTYIQSGNVIFETSEEDKKKLTSKIEKGLEKELGYEVIVILRTIADLEKLTKHNPFKKHKANSDISFYISFLKSRSVPELEANLLTYTNDLEHFDIINEDVAVSCQKNKGKLLFSNTFIEKKLNVAATTRNWTVVTKLVELYGN